MTLDTPERDALSIEEFCKSHGFSRATFYNLPLEDRPTLMKVAGRKRVSREAAAAWRRRMEARAAEESQRA